MQHAHHSVHACKMHACMLINNNATKRYKAGSRRFRPTEPTVAPWMAVLGYEPNEVAQAWGRGGSCVCVYAGCLLISLVALNTRSSVYLPLAALEQREPKLFALGRLLLHALLDIFVLHLQPQQTRKSTASTLFTLTGTFTGFSAPKPHRHALGVPQALHVLGQQPRTR